MKFFAPLAIMAVVASGVELEAEAGAEVESHYGGYGYGRSYGGYGGYRRGGYYGGYGRRYGGYGGYRRGGYGYY